jgi:hypothetical protein
MHLAEQRWRHAEATFDTNAKDRRPNIAKSDDEEARSSEERGSTASKHGSPKPGNSTLAVHIFDRELSADRTDFNGRRTEKPLAPPAEWPPLPVQPACVVNWGARDAPSLFSPQHGLGFASDRRMTYPASISTKTMKRSRDRRHCSISPGHNHKLLPQ